MNVWRALNNNNNNNNNKNKKNKRPKELHAWRSWHSKALLPCNQVAVPWERSLLSWTWRCQQVSGCPINSFSAKTTRLLSKQNPDRSQNVHPKASHVDIIGKYSGPLMRPKNGFGPKFQTLQRMDVLGQSASCTNVSAQLLQVPGAEIDKCP